MADTMPMRPVMAEAAGKGRKFGRMATMTSAMPKPVVT